MGGLEKGITQRHRVKREMGRLGIWGIFLIFQINAHLVWADTKPSQGAAVSAPALSQSTTQATSEKINPEPKPVQGQIEFKSGSNLYRGTGQSSDSTITLELSAALSKDFSLGAKAALRKNFQQEQKLSLSNTKISISHRALDINEHWKYSTALSGRIPTDEEARQKDRYITGVGLSPHIEFTSTPFSAYYQPTIVKNFHEYTINASGEPNIEYFLSQLINAALNITDRLSISASGEFLRSVTYRQYSKDRFDLSEELSYQLTNQWGVTIGHSNTADTLRPNGRDSNIAFFSLQTSTIYGATNYAF